MDRYGWEGKGAVLTAVKGSKLVAGLLRRCHAIEQWSYAGVIFAPEVVGNCQEGIISIFQR